MYMHTEVGVTSVVTDVSKCDPVTVVNTVVARKEGENIQEHLHELY